MVFDAAFQRKYFNMLTGPNIEIVMYASLRLMHIFLPYQFEHFTLCRIG